MAGNAGGAGEQQVVEGETGEGLPHFRPAGEDRDFLLVPGFSDHLRHHIRRRRGEFRRLDHGAVTRGEDPRQRAEGQVDREVPGRDHTDHAERLVLDAGAPAEEVEREHGRALLATHPLVEVLHGVFHRGDGGRHVREHGDFPRTAAEIAVQRLDDPVLVLEQHVDAALEAIPARAGADAALGNVVGALGFEHALHLRFGVGGGNGGLGGIHAGAPASLSL
jgi:hypothetical protein